uniref:Uncharacterized protein n=1 Tax=Arundo donax TaxID=35708 RepID=A0A0A9A4R5_ARUDO
MRVVIIILLPLSLSGNAASINFQSCSLHMSSITIKYLFSLKICTISRII